MEETLSVRITRKEFNEMIAIEKFQKGEVTLTKASEISGIPLTQFLDILHKKAINLHYGIEELREDIADLIK